MVLFLASRDNFPRDAVVTVSALVAATADGSIQGPGGDLNPDVV